MINREILKKKEKAAEKFGKNNLKHIFCPKSLKNLFESGVFIMGRSRHWKRQYFLIGLKDLNV